MKRLFQILLSIAVAFVAMACSENKKGGQAEVTVISYNIRYLGEPKNDGEHHWDYRKQASINMVQAEQPTVMGVQEALPEQLAFLDENLPRYDYVGVGRDDGVSAGEHMAVFYRKDAVELLSWGTFWLSESPDTPTMGWDAACYRTCTWTIMRDKATDKQFAVLNTHLDHRGEQAQERSMELIAKKIAEIVPADMPLFLTGDFNSTTDEPIYNYLRGVVEDSREVAAQTDRRGTFTGFRPQPNPVIIDHIFSRAAEIDRFSVLCDKNYGAPYISDHYPIKVEARF